MIDAKADFTNCLASITVEQLTEAALFAWGSGVVLEELGGMLQEALQGTLAEGPAEANGVAKSVVSVYRKMSNLEAETTLNTQQLQPPIPGSNSSKYLSESLDKVLAFRNSGVPADTSETVLEFVLDPQGYQDLMSTAVDQAGSKGLDAVKINYEGVSDPTLRNIGVPLSQLNEFNNLILQVNRVGP